MIRPFIDAHVHLNTTSAAKMMLAKEYGAQFITINTEVPDFISIKEQEEVAITLSKNFPGTTYHIFTIESKDFNSPGFVDKTIETIKKSRVLGRIGIKFWKNWGMDPALKDEVGRFITIDHPFLDPIFDYLEDQKILVLGHQGEPRNCWLTLDEMTMESDRKYYSANPQYHMYNKSNVLSYENQLLARDGRLIKNPNLRFVGLHLLSCEWSIAEVSKRLDQFPTIMTDLAERICHLQYQAVHQRDEVIAFFQKYQDQIIYGTDVIDDGTMSEDALLLRFQDLWNRHWSFFAETTWQRAPEFGASFQGLGLSSEILNKIFYQNAVNTYYLNQSR